MIPWGLWYKNAYHKISIIISFWCHVVSYSTISTAVYNGTMNIVSHKMCYGDILCIAIHVYTYTCLYIYIYIIHICIEIYTHIAMSYGTIITPPWPCIYIWHDCYQNDNPLTILDPWTWASLASAGRPPFLLGMGKNLQRRSTAIQTFKKMPQIEASKPNKHDFQILKISKEWLWYQLSVDLRLHLKKNTQQKKQQQPWVLTHPPHYCDK